MRTNSDSLPIIKADIGPDCSRCKLHTLGRKQVVFGVGNPNADLMFVGEAPGADEDVQGEPFVGRAGQLLTKIIEAIELRRDDVYIANVIKCRPPQMSSQAHPMHLHGFYFEVDSTGDGSKDTPIAPADRHPVVTHLLPPAATMSMTWMPERAGNWLFHCHLMHHVSTERRLNRSPSADHGHAGHDASSGMAGMILGVTVLDAAARGRRDRGAVRSPQDDADDGAPQCRR